MGSAAPPATWPNEGRANECSPRPAGGGAAAGEAETDAGRPATLPGAPRRNRPDGERRPPRTENAPPAPGLRSPAGTRGAGDGPPLLLLLLLPPPPPPPRDRAERQRARPPLAEGREGGREGQPGGAGADSGAPRSRAHTESAPLPARAPAKHVGGPAAAAPPPRGPRPAGESLPEAPGLARLRQCKAASSCPGLLRSSSSKEREAWSVPREPESPRSACRAGHLRGRCLRQRSAEPELSSPAARRRPDRRGPARLGAPLSAGLSSQEGLMLLLSRMAQGPWWPFLPILLLACLPSHSDSLAVMSVDLGSESMKIAIVKPGVPMEIVLNKESRRKTPVAVSLKENERFFGDSAAGMAIKSPKVTFRYFQDLLGKHIDNPQVAQYQLRFPEHELVKDARRETVNFKLSDQLQYSPEEILGMVLNYSRALAEEFAEQTIKDAVITVPAYFNQAERRAVLYAAQMAGLKVLQLINDNTAVALNYGVFRRKDINATAQNIMFYDMGAGSTVCTIVTYQTMKMKDSGTQPQLQIRGVGFDRTLGGLEMELRLRDHLAKLFNEKHPSKDVRKNFRSMAKLLKEANRLKTVLSANADHMAQIEGLLDDIDFKAKVSRQEFEDLCSDLFQRVAGPVQQALSSAEINLNEIDQVVLVGGATRVPKVQEFLLRAVGKDELGKNINADEAAAMGAVYQAAALSKAFKVKPFVVRDAAIFPIQVEFTREVEEEDKSKSLKHNRRILFQRMAPYPQRKVITFNRYTDDFEFHVNYADLGFLSESDLRVFGSLNLTRVKLRGVGESFKKHLDYESKGIKAHFNMDESGVLSLDRVESVFETVVEDKPEEESTLTKLGNTISSLFGGSSPVPDTTENLTETVQEEEESPAESGKDDQKDDSGTTSEEDEKQLPPSPSPTQEKAAEDASTAEDRQEEGGEKPDSPEAQEKPGSGKGEEPVKSPEGNGAKAEEEEKPKPPKKQKLVEEIMVELDVNDVPELLLEELQDSIKKLQDLTARDLEKQERERSANSLEAFIFETQDKLDQEEYRFVSTEEEREEISKKLSEASSWMEEEGYAAMTKELKERLSGLKKLCRSLFFRVEERRKWPDRLAALESLLNHSSFFLKGARMIPEADQIFTEVELSTLEKAINETALWKNETLAEQSKRLPTEKPTLFSKDIELKIAALDREVQYLLNKAKFAKPKPKPKKENTTKTEAGKNTTVPPESEKVIPPKEEKQGTDKLEDSSPIKEPPTEDKAPLGNQLGSETDSQTKKKPQTKDTRTNEEL